MEASSQKFSESEVGGRECASTHHREIVSVRSHAGRAVSYPMSFQNENLRLPTVSFLFDLEDLKFALDFSFPVQIWIFLLGPYRLAWETFSNLSSFVWDLLKNAFKDDSPRKCSHREFSKAVLKESS